MGHLRVPLLLASINLVVCTLLIAECREYWHFLLCQGFGVGVSAVNSHLRKLPVANYCALVGVMRSHIWTCDEHHRTLVQKTTSYSPGSCCFYGIFWGDGIPDYIPQLERYCRVSMNCYLSGPIPLTEYAQVQMDDENHRAHFIFRAGSCEFGMQCPSHRCPPTVINSKQTMRRRLPPGSVSGGLFNLQQFKSPAYLVYTASGFMAFLGLYTGQIA